MKCMPHSPHELVYAACDERHAQLLKWARPGEPYAVATSPVPKSADGEEAASRCLDAAGITRILHSPLGIQICRVRPGLPA